MVFSTALAQTAMKVMSKALNTFKSSGKSLGGMTSNFDALSKSMNGKHSNLGRSAKNAQRDLGSYSSNCASMSQATDNFIAGMQETESRVEELDNSAHEMFMKAFEQFQGKQISAVAGILVNQTTGADIFGKDNMGKKQSTPVEHRHLNPSAIATTVKFKVDGKVVEVALNEQEAVKWEKMKKAAGKKGLNRGDLAQMLGDEDLSKSEFWEKYGMKSYEKSAYDGYKKSMEDTLQWQEARAQESEAAANFTPEVAVLTKDDRVLTNSELKSLGIDTSTIHFKGISKQQQAVPVAATSYDIQSGDAKTNPAVLGYVTPEQRALMIATCAQENGSDGKGETGGFACGSAMLNKQEMVSGDNFYENMYNQCWAWYDYSDRGKQAVPKWVYFDDNGNLRPVAEIQRNLDAENVKSKTFVDRFSGDWELNTSDKTVQNVTPGVDAALSGTRCFNKDTIYWSGDGTWNYFSDTYQ